MPRILVAALALALAGGGGEALAEPQDEAQRKCLREVHKRVVGVARAQGKLGLTCLKQISRDQLVGLSWGGCSDADAGGKVAKASARTQTGREKKCLDGALPTGLAALDTPADVDAANATALAAATGLGDDILAQPATIVRAAGDKDGARCQAEILKRATKLLDVSWKEAMRGIDDALAAGAEPGPDVAAAAGSALTASAKRQKAELQLASKGAKKCEAVSAPLVFRGVCSAASAAEVAACAADRVRCRLCLALTDLHGLPFDCDAFDDAAANLSCSPFL